MSTPAEPGTRGQRGNRDTNGHEHPSVFRSSAGTTRRHIEAALDLDARRALIAVRQLLDEDLPWLEQRAVHLARAERLGWAKIARLLHRRRQSVWSRFRHLDGTPIPPPLAPTEYQERVLRAHLRSRADSRHRQEFDRLDPHDVVPW